MEKLKSEFGEEIANIIGELHEKLELIQNNYKNVFTKEKPLLGYFVEYIHHSGESFIMINNSFTHIDKYIRYWINDKDDELSGEIKSEITKCLDEFVQK